MRSKDLKYILNEQILAEWEDRKTSSPCTLGSCSLRNRYTTDLCMKAAVEPGSGDVHIYVSLVIDVHVNTKKRSKEFRLVLLPQFFNKNLELPITFKSLHMRDLPTSSILQQADLTNSGHIIQVKFDLASEGHIITSKSENYIKPATSTAIDLLQGLKSLSTAQSFNIYMRHSDYAKMGLQILNQQLRVATGPSQVNLTGIFSGRHAMFIDWANPESDNQPQASQENQLPLYVEGSLNVQVPQALPIPSKNSPPLYSETPPEIQVPRSPPKTTKDITPHQAAELVLDTPPRNLIYNSPIPPTASQTSDHSIVNISAESENTRWPPENDIGSDDEYYAILQAREWSQDREAVSFFNNREQFNDVEERRENEINSDDDYYDMLYAREMSLASEAPLVSAPESESLLSELKAWLAGATTINYDIYNHRRLIPRLFSLGQYARTLNVSALKSTKMWCSTILFFDPEDSMSELWASSRSLIIDIAKLIQWSNTCYCSPEMCLPHIRCEFIRLGSAARTVAMKPQCAKSLAEYRSQRAQCLAVILMEFGGSAP